MTARLDVAHLHGSLAPARAALAARAADVLAEQITVSEIPAPTGEEQQRGTWVAQRFRALQLTDIGTDDAGNVAGTFAGTSSDAPVVVCAHLDTVFPRSAISHAQHDGTRVHLPGIGDNGRGLAAMLAIARAMRDARIAPRRPLRFVATTGEEGHGDLRGAKHFFANNQASAAIALDGTGDTRIVHRAVGSRRFRVTFDGPGGHSWTDFGAVNPVHASAIAIAKLSALPLPSDPHTTLTVAQTGGGLSVNSIPASAWFEADIRSLSETPIAQLEDALRGIVAQTTLEANALRRADTSPLTAHFALIGSRPAGDIPASESLVDIAQRATRLIAREPELAHASTDANVPLSMGIPAIAIGGGGLGGAVHTTTEWYDDTDGLRGIERALTIVAAAAH
ncbi:MAG TPA: M20/M25/M40 family metallo-hydrolase [Gemmatimonadaceae bacterium]|nr:M20/M25/M40 family metallo-hydrolase [Gemmatimonadaceae bacterium]